jgi:chemotaxis protein histidine kinase CheA
MQDQLRALIERHLVHLADQLAAVAKLLTPAGETLPVAQVVEAEAIMHQLKGAAGSMGFAEIGAATSALDESLKALMTSSAPIPAGALTPVLELLGDLQRKAGGTTPEMSALYNVDLARLAQ